MSGAPRRTRPRLLDTAFGVLLLLAVLLVHAIDRMNVRPRAVGVPEQANLLSAPPLLDVAELTPEPPRSDPSPPPKAVAPPAQAEVQAKVQAPTPPPAPKRLESSPVAVNVRRAAPEVVNSLLTQPGLNKFGNPEGKGIGLAGPGEFQGARLLVWIADNRLADDAFPADNPLWAALKEIGFEVRLERNMFQPNWLQEADQIWIFTSNKPILTDSQIANLIAYVDGGKGLYLLADNEPFLVDTDRIVQRMFGTHISGNFRGTNLIAVRGHGVTRDDFRRSGLPKNFKADARETRSLLNVIEKTTSYVDEHPLLTDVNFIYEGVTISHIDPTPRLQTVLRASDGQVLSAVSVDPRQRIVVDCGFTRFLYGPRSSVRLVTETAGTLRYAENIAAYLMGKDDKGGEGSKWLERRALLAKYQDATEPAIVAALRSADPDERWAALTAALKRRLNIPEPLVGLIDDARPDICGQARRALVQLAGGRDYGPPPNPSDTEREAAHKGWASWLKRVKLAENALSLSEAEIVAMLGRSAPDERAAALGAALRRRLDLPDLFIGLLRDPDVDIRQDARSALAQLATTVDFGPAPDAQELAREAAIENWNRWRVARKYPDLARNATAKDVSTALHSSIPDERWAAVLAIRQRRLPLVIDLIDALSDPQVVIQQDARQTLKLLASNQDHGPEPGATPDAIKEAADAWKNWWNLKDEKETSQMLKLARALQKKNPRAARERFQEIIDKHPGTDAAREAQSALDKMR